MSLAKLTMIGFNTYLYQNNQQTLFDKMVLPTGIDKDLVVDNIMLQGGEFEVLYSNPYFMRDAVEIWSKKWYRTFLKWAEVLDMEYNPLENYDRSENWTDQLNRGASSNSRRDSGNTRTFNNTDTETLDTTNERTLDTTTTSEDTVSAFDSSTYQPSNKNETDNDGTDTLTNTGTDTFDHTGTITDEFGEGASATEKENSKTEHDGRVHGNIGIRSSQELLTQELEVQKFNLVEQITDLFLKEFCILVYE